MKITRKTVVASAGGFALTMGFVIILVLLSMLLPFPSPYIIFALSLLIIFPFLLRKLDRFDTENAIIGWTFIGLGSQLIILPLPLLFLVLKFPTGSGIIFGGIILTGSVIFGVPAGLLAASAGVFLVKRKR